MKVPMIRQSDTTSWAKSVISESDLFDSKWYLTCNGDVAAAKMDPLDHYLSSGALEGRNPNSLFDSSWYLREYPDVAIAGLNPLAHYVSSGAREGRDPHPNFSTDWYLSQCPQLADGGINPLAHYLRHGKAAGIAPFPPDRTYRHHLTKERYQYTLELPELTRHIDVMIHRPRFILLIEGDDGPGLAATSESCFAQIYPNWMIARTKTEVAGPRVIGDEANSFLIWLSAGDRLSPRALYACAALLNAQTNADLIYFDEDELHPEGRRQPFHKPDWSPDYLEAMNYIGSAACFRLSLAIDLLSISDGLYDFTLRFVEATKEIHHLRQILLHRKVGPSQLILPDQAAMEMRALRGRLQRTDREGDVAQNVDGMGSYDVRIVLRDKPLISVIIPTAGKVVEQEGRRLDLLANCIDTILARSSYQNLEFVIIDNGDFDRSRLAHAGLSRFKFGSFLEPDFNVAKKINLGATLASGSMYLLLNDDIEPLVDNWIERMLEHFEKPHVGVVGAKLVYPDHTTQHVGVVLNANNADHVRRSVPRDDPGYFFSTCGVRNFHAVTGAVMMTPAARFREVGGYTEALAISFNDVDYCLKLGERGYMAVYAPKAELIHYESQSREARLDWSEYAYFHRRWAILTKDAFYNEDCLTVAPPTFEVRYNERYI